MYIYIIYIYAYYANILYVNIYCCKNDWWYKDKGENHPGWFYLRVTNNLRHLCFLLDVRPRNPYAMRSTPSVTEMSAKHCQNVLLCSQMTGKLDPLQVNDNKKIHCTSDYLQWDTILCWWVFKRWTFRH